MAVSDVEAIESFELTPVAPLRARSKRRQLAEAAAYLVVGVGAVYAGLVPLGHVTGVVKVPVVLAGVAALFLACDRAGKAIWGRSFDTGFWLSATWVGLLTLATLTADLLPLGNSDDLSKTGATVGNLRPDLFSSHPLGTNNFSFDLLARSIYAARVSLGTALVAVGVGLVVGGLVGLCAGYFRGKVDAVVGVLTDTVLALPALVLLIAIFAVLGPPTTVPDAILKEGLALAVVSIPTIVRVARANTLTFAQRDFVLSARAMGAKSSRIIFRELLPNVVLPLISYAFIIMAVLIVVEGTLAFLGLGLQPPTPTWGNMIAEGAGGGNNPEVLSKYPHIALVPGAFMFLTVFSLNRIGEYARRRLDPREAKV